MAFGAVAMSFPFYICFLQHEPEATDNGSESDDPTFNCDMDESESEDGSSTSSHTVTSSSFTVLRWHEVSKQVLFHLHCFISDLSWMLLVISNLSEQMLSLKKLNMPQNAMMQGFADISLLRRVSSCYAAWYSLLAPSTILAIKNPFTPFLLHLFLLHQKCVLLQQTGYSVSGRNISSVASHHEAGTNHIFTFTFRLIIKMHPSYLN